jgi:iron complex outermembrane receptor protein
VGITSTVARAADWVGYDRAALSTALANASVASRDLEGANLRRYWMRYGGVTRWRASLSYRLFGDVAAVIDGDNLLNVQRGAPDNASVLVGRTLTFGVRTAF